MASDDDFDDWNTGSMREYGEQLRAYLDGQGAVEALRRRSQPHPPWPEEDNPMLSYLMTRAAELLESDGARGAIVWLAVHAWFEGALDERAKLLRSLTA